MEQIKNQYGLFLFKSLLDYYKSHFVLPTLVYDNTQPSHSFEKEIFNTFFHDYMLHLIPHSVNGTIGDFKIINKILFSTLIGRKWPLSNYNFVNELDYITKMKSVNFQVEKNTLQIKHFFNDFIDNYIGYGLITKKKRNYIIDTRYLRNFEIRKRHSNLDCVVYLDNNLHFDYCKIKGKKRIDDFAIQECITALVTIVTLENHAFQIHFLVSDKFNLLLNTLDKKNPVYRLMIPFMHNPYLINESASISLLGQTGLCNWFNFTRNGLSQYYDYVKKNFKIRNLLMYRQLNGKSVIEKHKYLWFNCIFKFIKHFLSIQVDLDCDDFIMLLKNNYNDIYDENKTKLENMIDICTMFFFSNILHEVYSNTKIVKLNTNPYTLSTTWKQNNSSILGNKINNLGEQLEVNLIATITSIEAIRMDDEHWIELCCVNSQEKQIYNDFRTSISKLDIPENALLHPKNISSSISY
jgi:hypothetical protein